MKRDHLYLLQQKMANNILSSLPDIKGAYKFNTPIRNWFNIDCRAEILFKPKNIDELCYFLRNYKNREDLKIIGATSNIIFKDNIIKGVVIKLPPSFAKIEHKDNIIDIGCAALCQNVASYCANNGLSNLEFYSGIPGSIGGAIAMNAGCYGSETSDYQIEVMALNYNGEIKKFTNNQLGFDYRHNKIASNSSYIFISSRYNIVKKDDRTVKEKITQFKKLRQESQPIRAKTGGSTFKNPENNKAWQLIDGANCRGLAIGDAQISTKHCNFIINKNKATGQDIIELINLVKERVFKKYSILLEEEIKIY